MALWFPQLATGAMTQFPVRREVRRRTVVNELGDGSRVVLADAASGVVEWRLELRGLTTAEVAAIETLFRAVEGGLGTFTFLDPLDNLLAWSEEFERPEWVKDPLLAVAGRRLVNGSAARQGMRQTIAAPGWFEYCFSAYVRGEQSGEIALVRGEEEARFAVGPGWRRVEWGTKQDDGAETVTFGVVVESGQAVEVGGMQVEAQPAASGYKKTLGRSGVYVAARFAGDVFEVETSGANEHACRLRVVARMV